MQNSTKKKIKRIKRVKRPIIRPCPCAAHHVSCGYVVVSHILGCPYNCSYCFLHTFYGKDEIVVYDREDDIIAQLSNYMREAKGPLRIGTGQYSDSLALDKETGLSQRLIELFAEQERHLLELKTKSAEVDHLLDLDHKGRTVFAWSVNPEIIVKSDEIGSVSLAHRISGAKKCVEAGYSVAFHFDPIIFYTGWDKDYKEVVDLIFSEINPENIAWISLGALRFQPELKDIVKERFPHSRITFEELEVGKDGKMRYFRPIRIELFKKMQEFIRSHAKECYVYLCMENLDIWKAAKIQNQKDNAYAEFFRFFCKI